MNNSFKQCSKSHKLSTLIGNVWKPSSSVIPHTKKSPGDKNNWTNLSEFHNNMHLSSWVLRTTKYAYIIEYRHDHRTTSAAFVVKAAALSDNDLLCWAVWNVWDDGINQCRDKTFPLYDTSPNKAVLCIHLAWKKRELGSCDGRLGDGLREANCRQFSIQTVRADSWNHN